MDFNVKKLSNDGGDLLYVEGAERSNSSRMSGRFCGFSPLMLVSAGEWVNTYIYQEL
jgi:hypothetical protein